ncbi:MULTISPECIES: chemotaxis response regulator protein-glutamate methylesterase [Paraburkholderia]|uniref:chemotaxis response regulator protein-glutamate methylesterase n=1 Tax=Paraburkholderia TaxID=1822464 RepID=UPI0022542F55|nr:MULTISPECIES: chemotaxis response regulator protein-glutamate methylesterase [Paraburkholderia]MCX4156329.1 chemotaxis response regulator protein-glutamate methylesterase [Paraburkholderia aspalathi]MDN7165734.1 chemotaxis response regulator protein-glutamate methylesterase [Paraburkholderia sp. SECH2]MDQ6394220.1 chemotaxis response regulator protein-glutamate methylesterase [Paraburkholderia aspalathi]
MKIGIVNDLPLAVEALRRALAARHDYEVLWVAQDGQQAVDFCTAQRPDIVLMDLVMPNVDGIEATRRIMAKAPCAILIVTVDVGANAWRVYEAMGAGALDAVDTPSLSGPEANKSIATLIAKIDSIAALVTERSAPGAATASAPRTATNRDTPLVAIGASAGGPAALATLLAGLPKDFPAAIVIVQHVDAAFAAGMADWLNQQSALPVRIANEGDRPQAGIVLLAATDDHLHLKLPNVLGYTNVPAETPYRPSVDVFFHSVVARWPARAIGVLLTGMGRDGAIGLKAMRTKGYHTIAQDEATCAVYGMPKAAAALDAAAAILPLPRIAAALAAAVGTR